MHPVLHKEETNANNKMPQGLAEADKQTHALTSSSSRKESSVESARQISALPRAFIFQSA